ncbi:hypothetical protein PPACK8108_LOCUS18780 [Phakopsora pachyrhizi]|uniref:Uncharacterized protein n=1 Tax=Phakopsora pachyrhizi TaxID=170000 RepID=A0AAV0BDG8_PHAPC|nr:hypothetical protein PPACK8108_LOCUS18780 [Phakopsora pachyrhizi]
MKHPAGSCLEIWEDPNNLNIKELQAVLKSLGHGCNENKLRYPLYFEYVKLASVHSPRSIEVWTGQNWLDEDLPDEKYLSVPKLKIFLALNKIQFSSQAKQPELIKLYKSLQEERNQKRYSASVPKRKNQEASVTFLSTPSTTHSAVALTSPQKNKTTTSPSRKSPLVPKSSLPSCRKLRSQGSKSKEEHGFVYKPPSRHHYSTRQNSLKVSGSVQSETSTPYSAAVPLSAKRIERNVSPESSDRFKRRKGQASTVDQSIFNLQSEQTTSYSEDTQSIPAETEFCQNAKSPDITLFSEASTQASISGPILGRIKADCLASAPALHPASSKLVLCQNEDENSCFQSSAATPTSEVSKASLSGLILESRPESLASAPSLAIESSTSTSTASSSKALTSVPLEDSRSDFLALGPSSSLKSPSNPKYLTQSKLKEYLDCYDISYNFRAGRTKLSELYINLRLSENISDHDKGKRRKQERNVNSLSRNQATAGRRPKPRSQNNGCIADESGFVYKPPNRHSYSTCQSTALQSSAVDHSSCYSPSQFSAINQSLSNHQSETSTPYSAAAPLSAERIERSVSPESSDRFKRRKGQASTATPKSCGPTRTKSRSRILKKKNKDSNEPGFVYKPPNRHSYSTRQSTASQSSAVDHSSCYSPSQFSAINQSLSNHQSETSTPYSASVPLSAERIERSVSPESSDRFKRRKGQASTATPKSCGPTRTKSRSRILKKKNKDSNEPGFVYKPPNRHSYSTRQSTASQSSAVDHSSCYSPSQFSAINQSLSNHQSETSTPYSASVPLSAERIERSVSPESSDRFKRRKGQASTATPKSCGPTRTKSRSRILKKKNKDSNEPGFVYKPPNRHSYSTRQSTASQSSAVDHSSCYSPSQFSAINQSLSNHQSETSTPYSASVPLSAKRIERSVSPESSDRFKRRKGQASTATPKSCGPTRTKSRSRILKKKNKDSNEPGFVYKPPNRHSYSTRQSTASQSSAVDHSSCYSPSQFSAINQSLSKHQSETSTPYSAAVPLSAKRNERSALTSSCGSSSYNQCVHSTPITSPANSAIDMGRKNMLHKKWKTKARLRRNHNVTSLSQSSRRKRQSSRTKRQSQACTATGDFGFVYRPPDQMSFCDSEGSDVLMDGSNKRKKTINYPQASKRLRKPLVESQIHCHNRREIEPVEENLFSLGGHDCLPPLSKQIRGNLCESNESFVSQWRSSTHPRDLEAGVMGFMPSHSCSGKNLASEMLEGINRIAQGINSLQMIGIQGQSTGRKKATGEARDNALLARVRQHVATLFGKDLDTKKRIYPSPATRSERRLWRNDFDNISDDDELSSQSNEDIEGQDPLFPYPGGPGFRGASSQTLSIMWRAMCRSGVQSFRPDLSKPMSDRKNQLLWDLAYKLLLKLIKAGEYSDIDLEMCSEDKIYQTLVNHVKYLRRCYHEANNWTESDQQERDQRKRRVTRRSNRCKARTAYVMRHNALVPLINIVANCTSDDDTVAFSDLDEDDSETKIKTVAALHIPWRSPYIEEIMKNIDRLTELSSRSGPSSSSATEKVKRIRIGQSKTSFVQCPKGLHSECFDSEWLRNQQPSYISSLLMQNGTSLRKQLEILESLP